MIDLRAARNDPDGFRAAVARKDGAEAFDALLAADERWRSLVPRADELRGRLKLKGKPTPAELEELNRVKEELRVVEEQLAAAEAERDRLLEQVPNPPDPSAPDGETEEDAEEIRRVGEPTPEGPEHTEIGRFEMERAARLSGSRFGYLVGDTALLALALYRFALDKAVEHGHVPMLPPVLVREEAMYGTGFFPTERSNIYALAGRRPVPDRHVGGRARRLSSGRDPRRAAPALLRVLDMLPARGGRGGQGHARHVPRPPVQQGRALRLLRPGLGDRGARPAARDRGGDRRRPRPAVPRRQRRRRRPRRAGGEEVRHRGWFPHQQRYREITSTSNTTDYQARRLGIRYRPEGQKGTEFVATLNGTAVTDRFVLAILENFRGEVPDVLQPYGAPAAIER